MRLATLLAALTLPLIPHALPAQWQIQTTGTTADLRGIDSIGNGVAWASGSDGTILHTEDSGNTWQHCATPPGANKLDFRGIQAFSKDTAIVMSSGKGDLSRLYKTTNSCQTWKLLFTNPDKEGFWDAVLGHSEGSLYGSPPGLNGLILGDPATDQFTFLTFRDSYAASQPQKLVHSVGLHPEKDLSLYVDPTQQGAFAASNQSLAVAPHPSEGDLKAKRGPVWPFGIAFVTGGTGGAHLYTSKSQAGDQLETNSWNTTPLPLGNRTASSGAFAIALVSAPQRGVIVGGDYLHPEQPQRTAVFYDPLQTSWLAPTTPPHGYRSAVAHDPKSNTWITVGPNGTDISTDDGRNWQPLKPNPAAGDPPDADQRWNALSLPFVVGPGGRIGVLRPEALATVNK